jgi:hypothetical protein
MPDGFSFRVSFGETGEAFSYGSRIGDAAGFREAYEAATRAAPGRDEAEIRQLLAGELRSRNIDLPPHMISLLAASIAIGGADITVGEWGELDQPPDPPGLVSSLIGKVVGRVLARKFGEGQMRELMREVLTASPALSRLMQSGTPDPRLYIPEPGREPAPSEVIVDPDLAERMPWLVELPSERPPGIPRSALRTFSFEARLEEDDGMVIVRTSSGRIGKLSGRDAEAYLPHIRSARERDKVVAAMATGRITGHRSLHVTVRLGRMPGVCSPPGQFLGPDPPGGGQTPD